MPFHLALGINIDILAAFLFVFALVYGLLSYTKMFQGTKGASVVIALVVAFFSALYTPLVGFLVGILPFASILLVVIFLFIFVKKILIGEEKLRDALPIVVVLVISLLLVGVFWNNIWPALPMPLSPDNMLWLIGIFIVLLIYYAVWTQKG